MPTPEAQSAADDFFHVQPHWDTLHPKKKREVLAIAFDRFAAQRGDEADRLVHLFARVIVEGEGAFTGREWEAALCEAERINRGAPPQTGGGPAPDNELLHMTEHNVAVAAAAYCRSRNSLGYGHDSKLLHILEDTLAERDRVAQQPIAPQTGGGDAGERDEQLAEIRDNLINDPHILGASSVVFLLGLLDAARAALRSSHREGATAMREADALLMIRETDRGNALSGRAAAEAIRANPIPGE